jgi:hypothetical protein
MNIIDDDGVEQMGKIVQIPLDSDDFEPNYRLFAINMLLSKTQFDNLLRTLHAAKQIHAAKQRRMARFDIKLLNLKSNGGNDKTITLLDSAESDSSEVIYFNGIQVSNRIILEQKNNKRSFLKNLLGIN